MKKTKNPGWTFYPALLLLLILAGFSWANAPKKVKGSKNPEWFKCSSISDCTVARGLCGDAAGVSTKHLKSFEHWVARRQTSVRCADLVQSIGRAILKCENSVCTAARIPKSMESSRLVFASNASCDDISQCTVSRSVCGNPLGIAWTKRKEWEKEVRRRQLMVDCAFPVTSITKAILACENAHCVAGAVPTRSFEKPGANSVDPKR